MEPIGIRELKNNLSHYVRQVEGGKRISVTAHGRVVAELVPPGTRATASRKTKLSRYEQLVADGVIRPALEDGDPFPDDGHDLKPLLKPGEGLAILDWLRGDR
jgi:prevent-host-death family protein